MAKRSKKFNRNISVESDIFLDPIAINMIMEKYQNVMLEYGREIEDSVSAASPVLTGENEQRIGIAVSEKGEKFFGEMELEDGQIIKTEVEAFGSKGESRSYKPMKSAKSNYEILIASNSAYGGVLDKGRIIQKKKGSKRRKKGFQRRTKGSKYFSKTWNSMKRLLLQKLKDII